jgi:putative membrane protein
MVKKMDKSAGKHYMRIFFVGGAMGVANIIPGVSGGTIAVVFGIYEYLMEALGNFLTSKEKRKEYILFLTVLFSGSILAIFGLAWLLEQAFQNYPKPTVFFFIGLIIGSIPVVIKSYHDMRLRIGRGISFFLGLALVVWLALLQGNTAESVQSAAFSGYGIGDYLYFFICGAIAASAMIIPGVSGSFILILLGVYWTVLGALSGLTTILFTSGLTAELINRLLILSALGVGVVLGILVISRVMDYALKKFPAITMYFILGLIIGSIYQLFPGFALNVRGLGSVITFAVGMGISLAFGAEKK